jgi:hypothetical protein
MRISSKTSAAAFVALTLGLGSAAHAYDLAPRYTPRPQTDSERLNTFRPPPPAPRQDTIIDRAARAYENAPVRPSYDPKTNTPIIQYNKRF